MSQQAAGACILAVNATVFAYFTVWVLLLPMWAPEDAPWLHRAFPPRRWALVVPGLLLATLLAGLTAFVGLVLADVVPQSAPAQRRSEKDLYSYSRGGRRPVEQ
eukprot:gnl/TRDRNA2_/TRDRNA2_193072_c0_seq1.p2 gnl/TRDRNA2_/TRDRNA2_193072_c0~~gnl/TRDRNA2_/TRDRNA2_193072_c0_seq1.p2  ORF type:complete len:104 (+),score=19.04 gnl/TRDRNA2_/TRDRNA2_193072_c0_seq1:105-416(+)